MQVESIEFHRQPLPSGVWDHLTEAECVVKYKIRLSEPLVFGSEASQTWVGDSLWISGDSVQRRAGYLLYSITGAFTNAVGGEVPHIHGLSEEALIAAMLAA